MPSEPIGVKTKTGLIFNRDNSLNISAKFLAITLLVLGIIGFLLASATLASTQWPEILFFLSPYQFIGFKQALIIAVISSFFIVSGIGSILLAKDRKELGINDKQPNSVLEKNDLRIKEDAAITGSPQEILVDHKQPNSVLEKNDLRIKEDAAITGSPQEILVDHKLPNSGLEKNDLRIKEDAEIAGSPQEILIDHKQSHSGLEKNDLTIKEDAAITGSRQEILIDHKQPDTPQTFENRENRVDVSTSFTLPRSIFSVPCSIMFKDIKPINKLNQLPDSIIYTDQVKSVTYFKTTNSFVFKPKKFDSNIDQILRFSFECYRDNLECSQWCYWGRVFDVDGENERDTNLRFLPSTSSIGGRWYKVVADEQASIPNSSCILTVQVSKRILRPPSFPTLYYDEGQHIYFYSKKRGIFSRDKKYCCIYSELDNSWKLYFMNNKKEWQRDAKGYFFKKDWQKELVLDPQPSLSL